MKIETRVGIFIVGAISVFLYLSFNIGALRMDNKDHDSYVTYFEDVGGLDLKAPVKSSGVKIGWIDGIFLRAGGKAEVHVKVHKSHKLAMNAYAMIQQDGMLGGKYIELDMGDPSTGMLIPGSVLAIPGRSSANVSELIDQFKDIAVSVGDIAHSLKHVFATKEAEQLLKSTLHNIHNATDSIKNASAIVDRTLERNESNINRALDGVTRVTDSLQANIPAIMTDVKQATSDLQKKVFPEIAKIGPAFEAIEDTSVQAREGFREAEQVMEKINTGKGLVGKLINEDETYQDLKKTIKGLKDYVSRVRSLQLYLDLHSETLFKRETDYSKGYFDIKIRPSNDYFYNISLTSDEYGTIQREVIDTKRYDSSGDVLLTNSLSARDQVEFADRVAQTRRQPNSLTLGFQFGKRFNRLAFRIGMFENAFGAACDFYVPLNTDYVHWITSLEAFDFRGTKRIGDTRPHVKWINKVFFMKNFYSSFGIDDMVSKSNASPFFGGGLRFTDADLKYFMSLLGGAVKK